MNHKGINILITGIHGFVGSNLVNTLKDQYNIYGLDIVSPPKEGVIKTYTWADLENIPPIDVIIHLAGKAHDTKSQTNAQVYFDINTGLTQKIYDWFLTTDATKFIFFSSVKAAADKVEGDYLTEDVIPSPRGPYGESKIAAEKYIQKREEEPPAPKGEEEKKREEPPAPKGEEEKIQDSRAMGQEVSVEDQDYLLPTTDYPLPTTHHPLKKTYILRPCMIHGPGNKGNLNLLYQVVKKGIPYPLGAFENRRSFTSIDNLSFVIQQLIEKEILSGIYNVGDDETLSTNELIALMANTMNKPNRTWKWNKSLVEFCALIGTVLHLPLNIDRLQKLTENYVVSNEKLKKALGIQSMPVSAEVGFKKTIESFGGRGKR